MGAAPSDRSTPEVIDGNREAKLYREDSDEDLILDHVSKAKASFQKMPSFYEFFPFDPLKSKEVSCGIGVSFSSDGSRLKRVKGVGNLSPCINLLYPGDIIEKIDGESVVDMEWPEFGKRLVGPEGSRIHLSVRSKFCPQPISTYSQNLGCHDRLMMTSESCPSEIPRYELDVSKKSNSDLYDCFEERVDEIVVVRRFMPATYFSGQYKSRRSSETVKGIIELIARAAS